MFKIVFICELDRLMEFVDIFCELCEFVLGSCPNYEYIVYISFVEVDQVVVVSNSTIFYPYVYFGHKDICYCWCRFGAHGGSHVLNVQIRVEFKDVQS